MKNKNKNQVKPEKSEAKVLSINSHIESYRQAFETFRQFPSVPTIINVLHATMIADAKFSAIEFELNRLTEVSLDQFYGAYGSEFFLENNDELRLISMYRPRAENVSEVCELLWSVLGKIKGWELWGYQNYLVGLADYNYLHEKYPNLDEVSKSAIEESPKKGKLFDAIYGPLSEGLDAMEKKDEASKKVTAEATDMGFPMVPWAAWIGDLLGTRTKLKEGLHDLSDYLSSYYLSESEIEIEKLGFSTEEKKLSIDESNSLANIISFLIFLPLFKKYIDVGQHFEIKEFRRQRVELLSDLIFFENFVDQADYLIGISNLLMFNAKLGVASVANGLTTELELRRDFLRDVNAGCLDLACLVPLPATGFAQIVTAIDRFEGDRSENYALNEVFKVSSYGVLSSCDSESFDEMFSAAFGGLPPELASELQTRFEGTVCRWNIPLCHTRFLSSLYSNFWDDDIIIEKISDALFESDKKFAAATRFFKEDLFRSVDHEYCFSKYNHPALFAKKFSNSVDFMDFNDNDWIIFTEALELAGQLRLSSTVLAMYITFCGAKQFYNTDNQVIIDIPAVIKLCKKLATIDSFEMVRQAIADLFEMYEVIPPTLKGSLKEYLLPQKAELTALSIKEEGRFSQYKKSLMQTELLLTRLSVEAQELLVKGYTLARARELAVFNLSSDAVRNYLLGIEGELRSRAGNLDHGLVEELQFLGVDIDWKPGDGRSGRRAVFKGIGGICVLVERYSKLSPVAKAKLKGFAGIASHNDVSKFLVSMKNLTRIRNSVQHADSHSSAGTGVAVDLDTVEQLLFGDGGVVRILCESR